MNKYADTPLAYYQNYRIGFSDFDYKGDIHPFRILQMFQDITSIHCDKIKIGYYDIIKDNLMWVLTKIRYEQYKRIENEDLVLVTWVQPPSKIRYLREFAIYSKGEIAIKGNGEFCLIDAVKRRISLAKVQYPQGRYIEDINFSEDYYKFPPFNKSENTFVGIHDVIFSDLDPNKHANNTAYIKWIVDLDTTFQNHTIKEVQLNFIKECHKDAKVYIYKKAICDNIFEVSGLIDNQELSFNTYIKVN